MSSKKRLLGWQKLNAYHIISRTAGQEFLLGPSQREVFGKMLEKAARFCGVEVLTWCCLSNHFHLLVRLAEDRSETLRTRLRSSDEAFLKHLSILYKSVELRDIAAELKQLRDHGQDDAANVIVDRYLCRIGDLSVFVKELKQRFSIWYNHHHQRSGTLWDARYRSVLVESSPTALRTVAAYIDLNPIRAGMVTDPKDYRWCGYGRAMGGARRAQKGLQALLAEPDSSVNDNGNESHPSNATSITPRSWTSDAEDYRLLLFGKAVQLIDGDRDPKRTGVRPEQVADVLASGGKLPPHTLFLTKVRHLSAGTALGSAVFLQNLVTNRPDQVSANRQTGARPIRKLQVDDFFSLRDLR